MNRPQLLERIARSMSLARHGSEEYWPTCISEASQRLTMNALKARDAREGC